MAGVARGRGRGAAHGTPGPGRRPAQPAARRRQRAVRVQPPAQRYQPLRQAATRPRREHAHPAGLRPDRRPVDGVPAHDGARRVHQRRLAAVAAQPAPRANTANGAFPNAPGLLPGSGGRTDTWSLQLAPYFTTTWLPLPYPILDLHVRGGWRYDSRTLDVALTGRSAPPALSYTATAFSPTIAAQTLGAAVEAPRKVLKPMTEVPRDLPEVIKTRAHEVTKGATTDFPKAVALQNWFREGGGFRYSLQQRSRVRDGSARRLRHRRPRRLLRAVRGRDGRDGPRTGHPLAGRRGLPATGPRSRTAGSSTPATSGTRWPEMYFSGIGWVRFEPTPSAASRRHPRTPGRSTPPDTDAGAELRPPPRAAPTGRRAADSREARRTTRWIRPVVAGRDGAGAGAARGLRRRSSARVQRRRRLSGTDPVHLAEGAWAELRATAPGPRAGLARPAITPRDQARRVVDQVARESRRGRSLEGLLVQVERGRYAARDRRTARVLTLVDEEQARTPSRPSSLAPGMLGSVDAGARLAEQAVAGLGARPRSLSCRRVVAGLSLGWLAGLSVALVATAFPALLHALHEGALLGGLAAIGVDGRAWRPAERRACGAYGWRDRRRSRRSGAGGRRSRRAGPRCSAAARRPARGDHARRRGRRWPNRPSPRSRGRRARSAGGPRHP